MASGNSTVAHELACRAGSVPGVCMACSKQCLAWATCPWLSHATAIMGNALACRRLVMWTGWLHPAESTQPSPTTSFLLLQNDGLTIIPPFPISLWVAPLTPDGLSFEPNTRPAAILQPQYSFQGAGGVSIYMCCRSQCYH